MWRNGLAALVALATLAALGESKLIFWPFVVAYRLFLSGSLRNFGLPGWLKHVTGHIPVAGPTRRAHKLTCILNHLTKDSSCIHNALHCNGVMLGLLPAAAATWLLVYCLVACIITWRDHSEAQYCKHYLQHEEQRDGNINRWMWTAGVASPNSASGTMSSFPAFDLPPDAKRPPQLLAPEFTASTLSPSPRKQGKRLAQQQSDQHVEQGPAERQVGHMHTLFPPCFRASPTW